MLRRGALIATAFVVHFRFDKSFVEPCMRPVLRDVMKRAREHADEKVVVVGHTDNKGTLEYNLDLSLRRAQSVVAALTSDFAVARSRLDARGVGFLAPVAPNTTEENRAKNRRVQLVPR